MSTNLTRGAYIVPTRTSNQSVKITKLKVDHFNCPPSGQRFLRDNELKGFALRATAGGAKTFIVEKRIEGKNRRITCLGIMARYGGVRRALDRAKTTGARLGRNVGVFRSEASLARSPVNNGTRRLAVGSEPRCP